MRARTPRLASAAVLGLLALASCASTDLEIAPGTDLAAIQSVFVERLPADERGVNRVLVDDFRRRGIEASTGEIDGAPEGVDAILTYEDRWMWDITMYMLELKVVLRNPENRFPLGSAETYRPSLQRRSTERMVAEVLDTLYDVDSGFEESEDGGGDVDP